MEAGKPAGEPAEKGEDKLTSKPDWRKLLPWGVVALAVIVGVIAWVATRDSGGGSSEPTPVEAVAPRIVTVPQLRKAAATLGQPIYWVGPYVEAPPHSARDRPSDIRLVTHNHLLHSPDLVA